MKLHSVHGDEYVYTCLWCGKAKLYVNWKLGKFLCFRCGHKGGSRILAKLRGERPVYFVHDDHHQVQPLPALTYAPGVRGTAVSYFLDHQINPQFAEQCGARSGTHALEHRIIFRVFGHDAANQRLLRYASAHSAVDWIKPKNLGYGEKYPWTVASPIPRKLGSPIILVEGPADALRVAAVVDHAWAICLFGQTCSDEALEKIVTHANPTLVIPYFQHYGPNKSFRHPIVIMFDGGLLEKRNALAVQKRLSTKPVTTTIATLPEGEDPCTVTAQELRDVVAEALARCSGD